MSSSRLWLERFTWEFVTAQNELLCVRKSAHHGPTSDGHAPAKLIWEDARMRRLDLFEVIEVCRKCHRLAPFTNYNGNTFAAIARILIKQLQLPPDREYVIRSLAGHIVAGVASDEEIRAFRDFCGTVG